VTLSDVSASLQKGNVFGAPLPVSYLHQIILNFSEERFVIATSCIDITCSNREVAVM